MKTFSAKAKDIKRSWFVINAEGKVLGRLASEIAIRLRGKDKPVYTPHVDCGDFIIVTNAGKIKVTGNKLADKKYYRHSEHPGQLKSTTLGKLLESNPIKVIQRAVKGMLPKGPLGRDMFRKLKVYSGPEHPHTAQQPETLQT